MSVKLMSLVWDSAIDDVHELSVLLVLADFANDEGFCYPSQVSIAEKARVSREFANRTINKYVSQETIDKTTHNGKLAYIFHANKLPKKEKYLAPKTREKTGTGCDSQSQGKSYTVIPSHTGCDSQSQGGVIPSHTGCDSQSQPSEPSMNRQGEPSMNHHTHTASVEIVAAGENSVCVSDSDAVSLPANSYWKSEHNATTINAYAKAHGLGNGWIVEAIKTALYDSMITEYLAKPAEPQTSDNDAQQTKPSQAQMTLREATQRVGSISSMMSQDDLGSLIDRLDVTEDDRKTLREKFLTKAEVTA